MDIVNFFSFPTMKHTDRNFDIKQVNVFCFFKRKFSSKYLPLYYHSGHFTIKNNNKILLEHQNKVFKIFSSKHFNQ